MRLQPQTEGIVQYKDTNIFNVNPEESFQLRKKMQIIFQDPFSSLNPKKTVRSILSEAYIIHKFGNADEINKEVESLCDRVQIPINLLDHYSHELDGGMRQVVGIARALSLNPDFVVCDEPVSSLDVSVQAQILNLLKDLQKLHKIAYIFVSHDIGVVNYMADRIVVMNRGSIIETGSAEKVFKSPVDPYTKKLVDSSFAKL
jgi:ABC-type glutathione transport system ATPase component